MDVASYAGGFVCNPDYLHNLASLFNQSFPQFLTNQKWQFAWAVWYSAITPLRPMQFTVQQPDYRVPFWGFPHEAIEEGVSSAKMSRLYDDVIRSTLCRLESSQPNDAAAAAAAAATAAADAAAACEEESGAPDVADVAAVVGVAGVAVLEEEGGAVSFPLSNVFSFVFSFVLGIIILKIIFACAFMLFCYYSMLRCSRRGYAALR
jgi:hypothetical protein